MKNILEISGLSKQFLLHTQRGKRIDALSGIDGVLEPGEILGLAGPSGSGKSTLMKCLYRTYLPTAGEIRFDSASFGEVDLVTAPESVVIELRRREITYCSQFLQVIPRVPAVEIAAEPLVRRGTPKAKALDRAKEVFVRLRLPEELWDAYPATFSGGEQQRVNIARAITAAPRLLLLDEPTASLDPVTKDAVMGLIQELRGEGCSMVLISHDPYTMSGLASRQWRLSGGCLQTEPVYA